MRINLLFFFLPLITGVFWAIGGFLFGFFVEGTKGGEGSWVLGMPFILACSMAISGTLTAAIFIRKCFFLGVFFSSFTGLIFGIFFTLILLAIGRIWLNYNEDNHQLWKVIQLNFGIKWGTIGFFIGILGGGAQAYCIKIFYCLFEKSKKNSFGGMFGLY